MEKGVIFDFSRSKKGKHKKKMEDELLQVARRKEETTILNNMKQSFQEKNEKMSEVEKLKAELEMTKLALRMSEQLQIVMQGELQDTRKMKKKISKQLLMDRARVNELEYNLENLDQAEGYLELYSLSSKKWQKVWVKVIYRYLYYFRSRQASVLLGHIDLYRSKIDKDTILDVSKKFCFQLTTENGEIFIFSTKTLELKDQWIQSMESMNGKPKRSLTMEPESQPRIEMTQRSASASNIQALKSQKNEETARNQSWFKKRIDSLKRRSILVPSQKSEYSNSPPFLFEEKMAKFSFNRESFREEYPHFEEESVFEFFQTKIQEEILARIFEYLKGTKHCWNVLCTCKRWFHVGRRIFNLNDESIVMWMYRNNKRNIARMLLMDCTFSCRNTNFPILTATEFSDWETLLWLLDNPVYDPSVDNNWIIQIAAEFGQVEVVKRLLKDERVDPSDDDNYAIRAAAEQGHHKVVKLLLADNRVDPSVNEDEPLQEAARNGHLKVIKILLQDGRVDATRVKQIAAGRTDIFIALGFV